MFHVVVVGQTETTVPWRKHNPFTSKLQKDNEEKWHARNKAYGLNEPWTWYDKCTKRYRNHGKLW